MEAIDVAITAWPNHPKRLEYFRTVVKALRDKLTASRHELRYHCSAESEVDPAHSWHGPELCHICDEEEISLSWREGPASLGGNMNAALRLCTAPTIFLVQDDWLLLRPLDLSDGADYLTANSDVDLIRYSWPGNLTHFIGCRGGWPIVDFADGWTYGDDPHLRRQDFMQKHGWYIEGGPHGRSEGDMLYRLRRAQATILASNELYFGTIGAVASVIEECRPRAVPR